MSEHGWMEDVEDLEEHPRLTSSIAWWSSITAGSTWISTSKPSSSPSSSIAPSSSGLLVAIAIGVVDLLRYLTLENVTCE